MIAEFLLRRIANDQPSVSLDPLVARILHVSASRLSKRVRDETGATILTHIDRMRLARGTQLLHDATLRIKEVATRAGYGCTSTFDSHFRKAAGTTPSAFRKTLS